MSIGPELHTGKCFCGTVELTVSGAPLAMGYCHCNSCRSWSGGPVTTFTLWAPDAVKIVSGADKLGTFHKSENSLRRWCTVCGGHVLTEHPGMNLTDVFAGVIPTVPFRPSLHVNYEDTVMPMRDGLPKLKDFPSEHGGTGQMMAE